MSNEPASRSQEGGVWEAILDHATLQVAQYLASRQCDTFNPAGDVSLAMLRLVDKSTLYNIISERNCDRLCGYFGCVEQPRGLERRIGEVNVQWFEDTLASDSEAVDPPSDEESKGFVKPGTDGELAGLSAESEEVVYDDDLYTQESFRMARRDVDQLRRIRKWTNTKRMSRRQESRKQTPSNSSNAIRNSHSSIAFADRFCSDWCLDRYETEIKPRVLGFLDYSDPDLVACVGCLFPNLRLDVLQQLARAEVHGSPLMGRIVEREVACDASCSPVDSHSEEEKEQTNSAALQQYLTAMSDVRQVWRSAMSSASASRDHSSFRWAAAPRHDGAPGNSSPSTEKRATNNTTAGGEERVCVSWRTLSGPYLVHDFLMNLCGARCTQLFLSYYAANRSGIQQLLEATIPRAGNAFDDITRGVLRAIEGKWSNSTFGVKVSEALKVESQMEQQRRAMLARHLFTADSTAALSRFLLLDEEVLLTCGWSSVWQSLPPGLSPQVAGATNTFNSLLFPFSVPSPLLKPLHSSRESLELAVVFVIASSCVHPRMLKEFLVNGAQLDDVLEAIAVDKRDVEAALRLILLG